MAEYLVTGGAGFIGSNICEELVARGHGVCAYDDLSTGKIENLPSGGFGARFDLIIGMNNTGS